MLYVYIGCLTFGTLYAIVSALLGAHGFDHGGGDHGGGHGADHGDVPSPFNPLVIASAIATFGAVGLISKQGFGMGEVVSLLFALFFAGLVGTVIFFGVVKLMYNSQSNSTFSVSDLVGYDAEVTLTIPENGLGEVAIVVNGIRYNYSAKSEKNAGIGRGEKVVVQDVTGSVVTVTPKITIDDIDSIDVGDVKE